MLALGAVEPDGSRGIGDLICECPVRDIVRVGGRNKARPEAVVHGLAWRVEGGLSDGVVLGPETESDSVTLGSGDAVWLEDQLASLGSNGDLVVHCKSGASEGGSSEECREVHYDWV